MIRIITICLVFLLANALNTFGQTSNEQEKAVKKFELRPSSKEYAPVRRGNAYQPVMRSKIPTIRSQQALVSGRKSINPGRKIGRRNKAATIRKNRRIQGK